MTVSLIIVITALYWLALETNWLKVKLLVGRDVIVGASSPWRLSDSAVTSDMKRELLHKWFSFRVTKNDKLVRCHLQNSQPLCGWGYAYQYQDFAPETKIELTGVGYKTTIRSSNMAALKDAFRINRNPYVKVKL